MDDTNLYEKLKWMPDEAERASICNKEKMN